MLGFQKGGGEERTGSFCRLDCFKAGGEGCLDPSTLIMAEVLRYVLYKSWGILFFKRCMKRGIMATMRKNGMPLENKEGHRGRMCGHVLRGGWPCENHEQCRND